MKWHGMVLKATNENQMLLWLAMAVCAERHALKRRVCRMERGTVSIPFLPPMGGDSEAMSKSMDLGVELHLINIVIQLILSERKYYPSILLQLPISFLFGFVIDFWDMLLPNASNILMQILCLCGSVFFTAFGIMILVAMRLVLDPPTGTIQAISRVSSKSIGSVKVIYDCTCVVVSVLIGFIGTHHLVGFGIATIVSALLVGRVLTLLQKTIGKSKLLQI